MSRPCKALILGIETSCDETAAAVVEGGRRIVSNVLSSQVELHSRFGGVVPEIASRHHLESINSIVDQALKESGLDLHELQAIAVSNGPGLVGALIVGVATAKALSYAACLPLIAVNHVYAHIYANFLNSTQINFPLVALIASGGHTELLLMDDPWGTGSMQTLGRTRDDAAGEAFDKVARALGLGYPGGPLIDKLALKGDRDSIRFPRANLGHKYPWDFSFSGLKSSVINYIHRQHQAGDKIPLHDLAASFQRAVVETLVEKTVGAAREHRAASVLLAGGVASNSSLRETMSKELELFLPGVRLYYPPGLLCTDNAAMIAAAAHPLYLKSHFAGLDLNAQPGL